MKPLARGKARRGVVGSFRTSGTTAVTGSADTANSTGVAGSARTVSSTGVAGSADTSDSAGVAGSAGVWFPAINASGIDFNVRIHELRHAHASWLLAGGADLKSVMDRMGHTQIQGMSAHPAKRPRHAPHSTWPWPS